MKDHENFGAKKEPGRELPPELEARIVAWVLGEASAFEVAELQRLIAEKPELAIFKRRIEAVHGLVGEAARPVDASVRLAPERRAKLLAAIGGPEASEGNVTPIPQSESSTQKDRRRWRRWVAMSSTAAAAMVAMVIHFSEPTFSGTAKQRELILKSDDERRRVSSEAARRGAEVRRRKAIEVTAGEGPSLEFEKVKDAQASAPIAMDFSATFPPPPSASAPSSTLNRASPDQAALGFGGGQRGDRGRGGAGGGGGRAQPTSQTERENAVIVVSPSPALAVAKNFDSNVTTPESLRADAFGSGAATSDRYNLNAPSNSSLPPAHGIAGADRSLSYGFYNRANVTDTTLSTGSKGDVPLSPFEVSTAVDRGYAAGSTIAGVRVDAPLSILNESVALGSGKGITPSSTPEPKQETGAMVALNAPASVTATRTPLAKASVVDEKKEADLPFPRVAKPVDDSLRAEVATSVQAVSTFSLHVSDVSFRLAREALARGARPDAATIRPEEFYNAFDYGDPAPLAGEPVASSIEQASHPFLQQRNLIRVAMKVPATGRATGQPLRLTVMLDTSGSMEREDRVASVRRAIEALVALLGAEDRVTLIGFARTPRLLADRLPGDKAAQLNELVRQIPSEGGTNLEEALKLASQLARVQFMSGAQNRIVLLTDGAANLGNADPAQLAASVVALRQQGIAFDACGVGLNGLDDSVLEALTRQGDGRYTVINSPDDADTRFARQLAGALRPAARDVKVQVRFNPARVRSYRLIGFEQHRLREEDFRNDAVDAAELAAEEAAVALYQVEPMPEGDGELGEVLVRFRRADTGELVERTWPLSYLAQPPRFDRATPSLQLAGTAALLAEKLRGGAPAASIRLDELAPVVNALRGQFAQDARVRDFVTMFGQARRMVGE